MADKPKWIDDGLVNHENVTVYVCDAEDKMSGAAYDSHINVGDNGDLYHLIYEGSAHLHDRMTIREAWEDAADWMRESAKNLTEFADWIDESIDEIERAEDL